PFLFLSLYFIPPLCIFSTLLFRLYIKKPPNFGAFSLFAFWPDVWPDDSYNILYRFGRFHLVTQRIEGVIRFRLLVAAYEQYAFKVGLRQHHPYTRSEERRVGKECVRRWWARE